MSKRIGVSYSWAAERENGVHAGAVDKFCNRLAKLNIEVVRDKDEVNYGDSLRAYMENLGASDHLCIFLSESYLRSENCMLELQTAYNRSRHDPNELRERLHVWPMDEVDLSDAKTRFGWRDHWNDEVEKYRALFEAGGSKGIGARETQKFEDQQQFAQNVMEILNFLGDMLSPRSLDDFVDWIAEDEDPVDASSVYNQIIFEMNDILALNEPLAKFLYSAAQNILTKENEVWGLTDHVLPAAYCPADDLKRIAQRLKGSSLNTLGQRDDIQLFCAGLASLGLQPSWLVKARSDMAAGPVTIPGTKLTAPLGLGENAHVVPLLAAALAGTVTRLDRVFQFSQAAEKAGETGLRIRRPEVPDGTNPIDRELFLKRHFIRQVLGVHEVPPEDATKDQVDSKFLEVLDVMRLFLQEGKAFTADDPGFIAIRNELKLRDLLVFIPSGSGRLDDIFPQTIAIFTQLKKIYTIICAKDP